MKLRPILTHPITTILLTVILLTACGGGGEKAKEHAQAKGGVKYGGVFRYNETEYLKSMYPLSITEVVGHHIVSQIYEGLVHFNPKDLTILPCLAESWTMDSAGKLYTFKIRRGVFFHDDACFPEGKGREMTAHDFEYCWRLLCTPDAKNNGFSFAMDVIKGSGEFYKNKGQGNLGVTALNDSVFQVELEKPYADFMERIALPFFNVFPKEAVEKYKGDILSHTVGTGAFKLKAAKQNETVLLVRNDKYWGYDEHGNQLPYLDGVQVSFIKEDKTAMLEFEKGNAEMKYRLPFSMIDEIMDGNEGLKDKYKKFQFLSQPELSIQFYGFLVPDKVFNNKNVRLAFNYAVDRASISDYTAKGEGTQAKYGFVPLGIPGYDNTQVKGFTFDVKKAKEYMAKAGYPDGKGFPKVTLEINSGGGRNEDIAVAIKKMLTENLNIEVDITQVIWAQHTNNVETAKANFWRFGWVADYPNPVNFLSLFYGKNIPKTLEESSYANPTRYSNPQYDAIYEKALYTINAAERNKLYNQLDQMIVDDAPVLLIYYSMNRKLLQPYVKNYFNNGMDYRSVRETWLDK